MEHDIFEFAEKIAKEFGPASPSANWFAIEGHPNVTKNLQFSALTF
jgi:hypothetical protein